ncbi:MAG: hypothetical protein IT372_29590 [Polyangiaceae bacterium]|nr:hypothetical protein [Polyangiaceae bacterium]
MSAQEGDDRAKDDRANDDPRLPEDDAVPGVRGLRAASVEAGGPEQPCPDEHPCDPGTWGGEGGAGSYRGAPVLSVAPEQEPAGRREDERGEAPPPGPGVD